MSKENIGSFIDDDLSYQLNNPEFASEFILAALEENDPEYLKEALLHVVKAKGVSKISENSNINRQAIYKMLSSDGNPTLNNLYALLDALGLKMSVKPKDSGKKVS